MTSLLHIIWLLRLDNADNDRSMSLLASSHYTFEFQFPLIMEPHCHPPIRSQLRYTYIMIRLVMEYGNVRHCGNIKILRIWHSCSRILKGALMTISWSIVPDVLSMVCCVSCQGGGRGTMRLDHVMASIMYKSCELLQIIVWPVIIEPGPWHWSGIVEHWHDIEHSTSCFVSLNASTVAFNQNSNPVQTKLPFL